MRNITIAQKAASFVITPKEQNSMEHAVSLLIEQAVLPKEIQQYTKEEMQEYILIWLRQNKK